MRLAFFVSLLTLIPTLATRNAPLPIDRVEEDWELIVHTTDLPAAGPQITTAMSPGPVAAHPDINFNLNYREGTSFLAGGLQVEVFENASMLAAVESGAASLHTDNETITWTQKLAIAAGALTYRIELGHSTTWGDFGGDALSVSIPSALGDLGDYSPEYSRSKSGIGWQADHVGSMKLLRVRYYSGDTLIRTDDVPLVVHPAI